MVKFYIQRMATIVSKFIARLLVFVFVINYPIICHSQIQSNICQHKGIVAGYYNGVLNTSFKARDGMSQLKAVIGTKTSNGVDIEWDVFYNTSESLWADLVEVFDQKAKAQNVYVAERWKLFWEAVSGEGVSEGWAGFIVDSELS